MFSNPPEHDNDEILETETPQALPFPFLIKEKGVNKIFLRESN